MFEYWVIKDKHPQRGKDESIVCALPETVEAQMDAGLIAEDAELLFTIEAPDFESALKDLHKRMDWGEYKPRPLSAVILGLDRPRMLYGAP